MTATGVAFVVGALLSRAGLEERKTDSRKIIHGS